MANSYFYSNVALATTLSGSVSAGATSIGVAATTGFPGSTPYVLALDYGASTEELVLVTGVASLTLTVTRGYGGTSAQSHSLGATVRHVINAQDLTDFRTHEAATAAVHGVTGTLVGTSDSQTLSNKTLTSPTVNSGALSGTFSGAHTYSGAVTLSGGGTLSGTFTGNPTLSGTVNHTGVVSSTQSASGNVVLGALVTADTFDRFRIYGDGKHEWGSGSATRDVNLYRSSADVLKTDDKVLSERASVGGDCFAAKVVGDAGDRLLVTTDSTGAVVKWGTGSGAPDTNLYRESNGVLKTDGGLKTGGAITDVGTGITYRYMQSGSVTFNFSAASQVDVTVTFATAFASTPRVGAIFTSLPSGSSALILRASSVSTTGMTLRANDVGGTNRTLSITADWEAFAA